MAFTDLIESLRGWGRTAIFDGIRLTSPIHDQGSIVIHQRVPLRPVAEMVAEHARTVWRVSGPVELGSTLLFHTVEGEYACELPVKAMGPNGEEGHWVAFVIGDDYAVLIDGIAALEHWGPMRDRVYMLAENHYLALGEVRRRKYEYQPPPGWNGLRRATSTWWYHPEYPRHMAVIKVFDARPAAVSTPDILDRMLFVESAIVPDEPPTPPVPCRTRYGLVGNVIRGNGLMDGIPVTFAATVLTDDRFAYLARLEVHRDLFVEAGLVLGTLVDSIVALPRSTIRSTTPNLIHWIE